MSRARSGSVIGAAIVAAFITTAISASPLSAEPAAAQPVPGVLAGYGSKVLSIRIPRSSPLVVTGRYGGQDNFIIDLVGQGADENLFNVIGPYTGQSAVEKLRAGIYRVSVRADAGSWSLRFSQPTPCTCAARLPGTVRGYGSRVVQVRTTRAMQPVFTAAYNGHDNFIVDVIGIGDTTGALNVFNEIGPYHGQMLADQRIPKGHYLLYVRADAGSWSISITP
jgi:hypothetical protein